MRTFLIKVAVAVVIVAVWVVYEIIKHCVSSRKQVQVRASEKPRVEISGPAPADMTPEELAGISDWDLTMRVNEYQLNSRDFTLHYRPHYEKLYRESKSKFAVEAAVDLDGEVRNGGFVQFFFNTDNQVNDLTLEALEIVGAHKVADMFRRAVAAAAEELPEEIEDVSIPDRMRIVNEVNTSEGTLDKLDDDYYALSDEDDTIEVCGRYIRRHAAEFKFD